MLRALSPIRLTLCLVGALLTAVVGRSLCGWLGGEPVTLAAWLAAPHASTLALASRVASHWGRHPLAVLWTAVGLWLPWSLIGTWIVRHELLARRDLEASAAPFAGPSVVVRRRWLSLLGLAPMLVVLALVLWLLPWIVGFVCVRIGGVGTIVAALALPLALLICAPIVVLALGLTSLPLASAAVAAEGADAIESGVTGFNYLNVSPVRYAGSQALAAAPLVLAAGWITAPGLWWVAVVAALSLAWTRQASLYLGFRERVDGTAPEVLWDGASEREPAETPAETPAEPTADDALPRSLGDTVQLRPLVLGGGFAWLMGGALRVWLILLVGLASLRLAAGPEAPWSALGWIPAALRGLWDAQPVALAAAALVGLAVAALALRRSLHAAARSLAVLQVHQVGLDRAAAAARVRDAAVGLSGLLAAGGLATIAIALIAAPRRLCPMPAWGGLLGAGWCALVLGGGRIARRAVGDGDPDAPDSYAPRSTASSTLAWLLVGPWSTAYVALLLLGVWWVSGLALGAGEVPGWMRWHTAEGPSAHGASEVFAAAVAGLLYGVGLLVLLAHPLHQTLRWGTRAWLWARRAAGEDPLALSETERASVESSRRAQAAAAAATTATATTSEADGEAPTVDEAPPPAG